MNSTDEISSGTVVDDEASAVAALLEKLDDVFTPGFVAEFAPGEAELAGAFHENALNEADAMASHIDLVSSLTVDVGE
jgi:hypothetical protein